MSSSGRSLDKDPYHVCSLSVLGTMDPQGSHLQKMGLGHTPGQPGQPSLLSVTGPLGKSPALQSPDGHSSVVVSFWVLGPTWLYAGLTPGSAEGITWGIRESIPGLLRARSMPRQQ